MRIAVLGLGHVGSVAAACLAEAGHQVLGIDMDVGRVRSIQTGQANFFEPGLDRLLQTVLDSRALTVKALDEVENPDAQVAVIAVGTPPLASGGADLSAVRSALGWLAERFPRRPLVMMKSTLPPGAGQNLARQFGVRYVANPEFLRQGQALHDWRRPDRIVIGGECQRDIQLAKKLYVDVEAPFLVTDLSTAEMIKYAGNAFLSTKVSFINEIANLCDHVEADIDDVVAGLGMDPRIGPSFLRAGIGYGGSCFPQDVRALEYASATNGYSCDLLKAVISVNKRQRLLPVYVLRRELGSLAGRQVAILGLTFKPGTDDLREAPALDIMTFLLGEGARVTAYDPVVKQGRCELPIEATITASAEDAVAGAEAAVLCTEWEEFSGLDWQSVRQAMRPPYLVIDGRNALPAEVLRNLGFRYVGVGRGRPTGAGSRWGKSCE